MLGEATYDPMYKTGLNGEATSKPILSTELPKAHGTLYAEESPAFLENQAFLALKFFVFSVSCVFFGPSFGDGDHRSQLEKKNAIFPRQKSRDPLIINSE